MTKKEEFIRALSVLTEQGYDPYIPLAHSWHESAGYKKVIGNYNWWGIKLPHNWQGKTVEVITHEYISGEKIKVVDIFIDFATPEQSLIFYADLVYRLYPDSWRHRAEYKQYFIGLVSGNFKYATDPSYYKKLTDLYDYLKENKVLDENTLRT